jgi:hypothetical protein
MSRNYEVMNEAFANSKGQAKPIGLFGVDDERLTLFGQIRLHKKVPNCRSLIFLCFMQGLSDRSAASI